MRQVVRRIVELDVDDPGAGIFGGGLDFSAVFQRCVLEMPAPQLNIVHAELLGKKGRHLQQPQIGFTRRVVLWLSLRESFAETNGGAAYTFHFRLLLW